MTYIIGYLLIQESEDRPKQSAANWWYHEKCWNFPNIFPDTANLPHILYWVISHGIKYKELDQVMAKIYING